MQYLALFIFVYFMSMPLLAAMFPNVSASFRSELWIRPEGWLYGVKPDTRLLIASVWVVCAYLSGVLDG